MKVTWNEMGTIIGLVIVCLIVYSNRNHPILTITGFITGFIATYFVRSFVRKCLETANEKHTNV